MPHCLQILIFTKGIWKWHTFIEVRLKWISKPYQNEFSYLIDLRNQKIKYNLGLSVSGGSYDRNITSKHSQFYYWHSKEQILSGCLCFTMKWWHKYHFVKIFLPLNILGIQYIFGGNLTLSPNTNQKTKQRSILFVTMLWRYICNLHICSWFDFEPPNQSWI